MLVFLTLIVLIRVQNLSWDTPKRGLTTFIWTDWGASK